MTLKHKIFDFNVKSLREFQNKHTAQKKTYDLTNKNTTITHTRTLKHTQTHT